MKQKKAGAVKPRGWWDLAYEGIDHIEPTYEYHLGKDDIVPGSPIKVKGQRGTYLFRCTATNLVSGSTWFDCIGPERQWHSFPLDKMKGLVKPKKFRRKTPK